MKETKIPIEVSARHIHISREDLDILFGKGYKFHKLKKISQPNQFAAGETVRVVGPKSDLKKVRLVGPVREQTQVELSITDCYTLGVEPHVAVSGQLDNSPGGLTLVGPVGTLVLKKGVIVPQRHLHISPPEAKKWGLQHLDIVKVRLGAVRQLIFDKVVVRSRQGIDSLALHLDTDEANAAGVRDGDEGFLIL